MHPLVPKHPWGKGGGPEGRHEGSPSPGSTSHKDLEKLLDHQDPISPSEMGVPALPYGMGSNGGGAGWLSCRLSRPDLLWETACPLWFPL